MATAQGRFRVGDLLVRLFSIDLRGLGIFRILLGIVLLSDYLGRLPYLDAHYTEAGVMPLKAAQTYAGTEYWLLFSPYVWNGSHDWSLGLMLLSMVAAVCLLLGWKTRLATFISWYLAISLHSRYPLVQEGGDVYIRQLLFWSLFLPLGARFSVDGLAARYVAYKQTLPRYVLSMGTVGILLQIGMVYWFNAIAKDSPQWRSDFTALYYALSLHAFSTPYGLWLRDNADWILKPLTAATMLLEAYGPFFAYIPVATHRIRPYVVAGFWYFHLVGIGMFMDVGPFTYIAAFPWTLFLPAEFWDRLERLWYILAPARVQNAWAQGKDALVAWRSRRIARDIQKGVPLPRIQPSLVNTLVCFVFFGYILNWNVRATNAPWALRYLPKPAMEVVWLTRVDQYWAMFSPTPLTVDYWYVIPAQTEDNTLFDIYKMRTPVNYDEPASVHEFYKSSRWRKYLTNIYDTQYANQRQFYVQWLVQEWNRTHKGTQALHAVWLCTVERPTSPNDRQPKPRLRVLYTYFNYADGGQPVPIPPGVPAELLPKPQMQGAAKNGVNRSR